MFQAGGGGGFRVVEAGVWGNFATRCVFHTIDKHETPPKKTNGGQAFRERGFMYKTAVITDYKDTSLLNGGVVIGSKWPAPPCLAPARLAAGLRCRP